MNNRKAYFLLPNTDIAPDTLVRLGQIVPSVREAHRAITPAPTLEKSPYTSCKTDYLFSTSTAKNTCVGLLAQFLAQLGSSLSGGLSVEGGEKNATTWKFNALETYFFEPDSAFLNKCVENADIKELLTKQKWGGNAVYMITGLKIARGASFTKNHSTKVGVTAELSLDASAIAGLPLSAGPELGVDMAKSEKESCSACSNFVWAIRVRKIRLTFWNNRLIAKEVYGGQLNNVDKKGTRQYLDDLRGKEEDEEQERRLKEVELEETDLGIYYTPKGFKKRDAIDEHGVECVAFL